MDTNSRFRPRVKLKVRPRVGVSLTDLPRTFAKVSGLLRFQERYLALLRSIGIQPVPIYCRPKGHNPIEGIEAFQTGNFSFPASLRCMYLRDEGARFGLKYSSGSDQLIEDLLKFYERQQLDAIHLIEWRSAGMAFWQAALDGHRPTAFTPTEHSPVCNYGFLLHNNGAACEGPEDGRKCERCTHSLEPTPDLVSLKTQWNSGRHKLFHRAAGLVPPSVRPSVLRILSNKMQQSDLVLSEPEAMSRVASARRFLSDPKISVAYQSPTQHRVFERALGIDLPAPLPAVLPFPEPAIPQPHKRTTRADLPATFIFAARPSYDRGLWLLLEAWRLWKPRPDVARLEIYTDETATWVDRHVSILMGLGVAIQVVYQVLDAEMLAAIHHRAHFVVCPSVWEDTGSATVMEGLYFGTPAIVPKGTGAGDYIDDTVNGYTFAFRDSASLCATLQKATRDIGNWYHLHKGALKSARAYSGLTKEYFRKYCEQILPGFSPDLAILSDAAETLHS